MIANIWIDHYNIATSCKAKLFSEYHKMSFKETLVHKWEVDSSPCFISLETN